MKINRVGVDLAMNVFQLHGADRKGKTTRDVQLIQYLIDIEGKSNTGSGLIFSWP